LRKCFRRFKGWYKRNGGSNYDSLKLSRTPHVIIIINIYTII